MQADRVNLRSILLIEYLLIFLSSISTTALFLLGLPVQSFMFGTIYSILTILLLSLIAKDVVNGTLSIIALIAVTGKTALLILITLYLTKLAVPELYYCLGGILMLIPACLILSLSNRI